MRQSIFDIYCFSIFFFWRKDLSLISNNCRRQKWGLQATLLPCLAKYTQVLCELADQFMYLIFSLNLLHIRSVLFNLLLILFQLSFKPLVLKKKKKKSNKQVIYNAISNATDYFSCPKRVELEGFHFFLTLTTCSCTVLTFKTSVVPTSQEYTTS